MQATSINAQPRKRRRFTTVQLMFVASVVLSVASYYTTYLGLTQYVAPEDWWLAAAITFGLQAIMFATAWIASEALTSSVRAFLVYLMIYILCAAVSIFFSFSSLFNSIFDENQRDAVNSNYLSSFYQEMVLDLGRRQDERLAGLHDTIVQGEAFVAWKTSVEAVNDLLRSAPEILERRLEALRAGLENELADLQANLAALAAQIEALRAEQKAATEDIAALDLRLGAAQTRLAEDKAIQVALIGKVAELEARMEAELQGIGTTAGVGPVYKGLERDRNTLLRDLVPIETRIKTAESNPDVQEKGRRTSRLQEISSELARLIARDEAGRRQLAETEAKLADTGTVRNVGGLASIALIDRAIRQAATAPDAMSDAVDKATGYCSSVLEELRADPQLAQQAQPMSCGADDLQIEITNLRALVARKAAYDGQCNAEVLPDPPGGKVFETLANATELCISASGIQDSSLRSDLAFLKSTRGPNAHPFVIAQNALFIDRLPVSYMAAIIATVMDLLILLVALMAQMARSSRAEKALRSMIAVKFEQRDGGNVAYIEILPGTYNHDERKRIADEMVGRNLAIYDDKGERLYVGPQGRHYLIRELDKLTT